MKIVNIAIITTVLIGLSGCGTVPKSRQHFNELMKEQSGVGPFKRMAYSKVINQPFNKVVENIRNKLEECVFKEYAVVYKNNIPSSPSVSNNVGVKLISDVEAEVTIQQKHAATFSQSEGGYYFATADIKKIDENSVNIDFYTYKHASKHAEYIEKWANGSDKCHGIGRKP